MADFEGACQKWTGKLLNSTRRYRTVKSFKSQYFQNYYLAVLSSTIIVIVSSDYLYITSVWGISEVSLSTRACQCEMTWLVGSPTGNLIGQMSVKMADGGIWLDDHWQCRYTSVLHNYHKHTLPEYCKLHKNSSVGSVCVNPEASAHVYSNITCVKHH